jgi:hypothetical protein
VRNFEKNEKYSEKIFQKFLDVHSEKEWGTLRAIEILKGGGAYRGWGS